MASRRDQFQAHRFLARRHAAALLSSDSDHAEGPLRRLTATTTASVMVAALAVAAVAVYGLLRPSGPASWKDGRSLVVERDTGTRYVYLSGTLHPVLNYASARLILRGGGTPVLVSSGDLAHTRHGAPVGIAGAPDSLPTAGTLLGRPWTVCSDPATDASGTAHPLVRVSGGATPAGTAVPAASGLLAQSADGTAYLVWNGARLRVAGDYVLNALNYANARPLAVGDGWLDALPQGPDLGPPAVPGIGGAGPVVAGAASTVGQLFQVSGGGAYVAYPDGLAPVSALQAALLAADPALSAAYAGGQVRALPLTAADAATAARSATTPARTAGLPSRAPTLLDTTAADLAVCASFTDAAGTAAPTVRTTTATPGTVSGTGSGPVDAFGGPVADSVDIPPGRGALVRALPGPGVTTGTLYLVTDLGLKFPLDSGAQSDLGLKSARPVVLPAAVVQLFRTGPTLSEAAAARTAPILPSTPSPAASPTG